MSETDIGG